MLTKWDICFTSVVNTWGYMGIYHVRALHGACKNKYLSRWFWFHIHSNTTINRTCVKKLPIQQWRQLQKCTMCTWRIWCLLELWLLHATIIYIYIFSICIYIYILYIYYLYVHIIACYRYIWYMYIIYIIYINIDPNSFHELASPLTGRPFAYCLPYFSHRISY